MGEEVLGWLVRVPAARKEREKLIEAGRCKLDPGFESTPGFKSSFDCEKDSTNSAFNLNPCLSELAPLHRGQGGRDEGEDLVRHLGYKLDASRELYKEVARVAQRTKFVGKMGL